MLNIIVCDDDQEILDRYSRLIKELARKNQIMISLSQQHSGEQLFFQLEENPNDVDIIYLDILMGEMNGIETAEKLRAAGCDAQIIFLTTSDEYVFDSFDVHPLHYLVKDRTSNAEFERIFIKACQSASKNEQECYIITKGSYTKRIPYSKISYFEVQSRVVTCHSEEGEENFYYRLDDLEAELSDKGFIRCHRAFIVNARFIAKIDKSEIVLSTGESIPLATRKYSEVKKTFSKYVSRRF